MSGDPMDRVVFMDEATSAQVDEWVSGFDMPPCFSCGSTTQGVAQRTINIRHGVRRGTYAFINVICRVCNDQMMASLAMQQAVTGETAIDKFNRSMGIDPATPDPEKMS